MDRLPQILDILISYLKFVQHIDRDTAKYGKNRDLDYDSDEEKEGRLTNREILSIFLSGSSALDSLVDNSDDEVEDEDSDEESDEEDEEIYFPNERVSYL